jgi:uncharacterized RDD family membrane protein YckC
VNETFAFAGIGRRFSAWLADLVFLLVLVGIAAAVLGGWDSYTRSTYRPDGSTLTSTSYYLNTLWSESLLALFSALYTIPSWRFGRATLGQRALGMLVLDAATPTRLSWLGSAIRWLALFGWTLVGIASYVSGVFTVVVVAWLVVLLASATRDSRKQGLHDHLARSLVVRRQRTHRIDDGLGAMTSGGN